ncbi:MAG: metallophosphoesterase family protein [Capsulimonadaceae bacterium]
MIYAVGDIHGQLDMLEPALEHLMKKLRMGDIVIFLGDYIDRGPESERVLKRIMRFRQQHMPTIFLRGNHEDLLLRAHQGDERREQMWLLSGGTPTLASFGLAGNANWKLKFPRWALDFLGTTQVAVKTEQYHFVHAGVVPYGVETEVEADLDPRMWIREPFILYGNSPGRTVVFGHTPQTDFRPLVHTNKVGLDTGACLPGGRLSVGGFDDTRPRRRMPEFTLFQVTSEGMVLPDEYVQDILAHVSDPPTKFSIPTLSRPAA